MVAWRSAAGVGSLLGVAGCLAAEGLLVGAYGDGSTSSAASSPTTSADSTSSGSHESSSDATAGSGPARGYDGRTCTTVDECVATAACQEVRCEDERCVLEFYDERCDEGLVCTLEGCQAPWLPCESRYDGVILCDDFEQGISTDWTSVSVELAPGDASQGGAAARSSAPAGEQSVLRLRLDEPLTEGMVVLRTFTWLDERAEIDPYAILYELMQLPAHPDMRISLDLRPNDDLMAVNRIGSDTTVSSESVLTPGQWHCIELLVTIDDTEGRVEGWVDDRVVFTGEAVDTLPAEGFSQFGVGLLRPASAVGSLEILIDDVVLATAPVGCD